MSCNLAEVIHNYFKAFPGTMSFFTGKSSNYSVKFSDCRTDLMISSQNFGEFQIRVLRKFADSLELLEMGIWEFEKAWEFDGI